MTQRWECLTFLHWTYEPQAVQALLPPGLQVELFEGQAWVGLVPFHMTTGPGAVESMPWLGSFHETNVRTYVVDRQGRPGVWFFSLDATRLAAVVTARVTYRLPYFWSSMDVRRDGDVVHYRCERRWPSSRAITSDVAVHVGAPVAAEEVTELEHFLTARWRLFSSARRGLRTAEVHHDPWPLRRAEVTRVDDHLIRAAGLPAPVGPPLVHFSEGVTVSIGRPRSVAG